MDDKLVRLDAHLRVDKIKIPHDEQEMPLVDAIKFLGLIAEIDRSLFSADMLRTWLDKIAGAYEHLCAHEQALCERHNDLNEYRYVGNSSFIPDSVQAEIAKEWSRLSTILDMVSLVERDSCSYHDR